MSEVKQRNPMYIVVVGQKGGGKTYTTIKKVIEPYCYGENPKRVLILDVNGEYTQFKTIGIDNVEKFSAHPIKEIRRIVPPTGMSLDDIANLLMAILKRYREGLLVIEDLNAYVGDNISRDIIGTLVRNRHFGVDLLTQHQGIGRAGHPKIVQNMTIMRLHKTGDDVDKGKFEDQYEIIKIGKIIVDNDYMYANRNRDKKDVLGTWVDLGGGEMEYKSTYVYINFIKNKISGKFNAEHFYKALQKYFNRNKKSTIGEYLDELDENGKPLYNYNTALNTCMYDYFVDYYGNPDREKVIMELQKKIKNNLTTT